MSDKQLSIIPLKMAQTFIYQAFVHPETLKLSNIVTSMIICSWNYRLSYSLQRALSRHDCWPSIPSHAFDEISLETKFYLSCFNHIWHWENNDLIRVSKCQVGQVRQVWHSHEFLYKFSKNSDKKACHLTYHLFHKKFNKLGW